MAVCSACQCENEAGAQFCGGCGAVLMPAQHAGASGTPSAALTPVDYDDPRHAELWREALESALVDGQVDVDEAAQLARLRTELRVSPATLERVEEEVRRQFRPRVAVKLHAAALMPVRVGSSVTVVTQIENIDPETCQEAWCELHVGALRFQQRESLGRFRYLAKERRAFQFRASEPGLVPAELRIVLVPRDGLPIVLRSRGGDLQFTIQPAEPGGAIVYNVRAERIVGDFGVDKGINIGSVVETPAAGRSGPAGEWRPLVLELAPELMEALAAERDRTARGRVVERPARYRAAELHVTSGSSVRRVTVVTTAVATLGRNSTAPGPGFMANDVELRVEPISDPRNAAATQQISGHAHLTFRYDGRDALLYDNSTHGTVVNRTLRLSRGESAPLVDRLDVRVAGVLDLLWETFRSATAPDAALPCLSAGAPREALDAALLGFDRPGDLDAVRVRRPGNLGAELEHLIIIRQARIGCSPYDALQLRGPGVRERHARLLVDREQLWLERLANDGVVRLNGQPLEVGQRIGLQGSDLIDVGEARLALRVP